jgi:negative regulator of flagellin synthesis FlgM
MRSVQGREDQAEKSMKINNSVVSGQSGKPAATGTTGTATDRVAAPAAKAQPASTPGASVQLSALSTQLAAIESSLTSGGVFDAARVEEIKQAIRDGSLQVHADVVAEKMLAGLQEMFAGVRQAR